MILGNACQLVGVPPEISVTDASRAMPIQYRARYHPSFAEKELLIDQRLDLCAEPSLQKPCAHHDRSTQSNRSFDR